MIATTTRTAPGLLTAAAAYTPKHGSGPGGSSKNAATGEKPSAQRGGGGPHRAVMVLLAVLVALLAGGYGAGVYVFSSHYYPGTTVVDTDISLLSAREALDAVETALGSYSLTVEGEGFSWTYEAEDISEVVDAAEVVEGILEQNDALAWPVHLAESLNGQWSFEVLNASATAADLPQSFDTEAFCASLAEAVEAFNEGRSGTFDQTSAYDEDAGAFSAEHALQNELLDADALAADALAAVAQLVDSVEVTSAHFEALVEGATDDELEAVCDAANAILQTTVSFTLADTEVASIAGSDLLAYISFDESLEVELDTGFLTEWAEALAEEYDTVGTERTYTREDGEEITVSGGTFGWEIDVDALVEAAAEALEAGESATVEVPTSSSADLVAASGERDWGAYIDVDISEQYAVYYDAEGNVVWESGVITGNTTKGNGTPTGIYYIRAKYRDITLQGRYDSETGEYAWETPVSYWMAFVGSSVGFHDATWQSESNFGVAGANTWTGSHGCVNLPLEAAAELYDLVYLGLCVIVHD